MTTSQASSRAEVSTTGVRLRQFLGLHADRILTYIAFVLFAVVVLVPFYWIFISSVTPKYELFQIPPIYFPSTLTLDNYNRMANGLPFWEYLVNSLIFAIGSSVLSVGLSGLAAYALARIRFPGSNLVFIGLILSIALPQIGLLVPMFETFKLFGLQNTHLGLILLMSSLVLPFTVWVLVSFVNQIPAEIEEAAQIDGANIAQVIVYVMLPTMRPALSTMLIINFVISWNELLYPLVFAQTRTTKTFSVGLLELATEGSTYGRPWDLMSALSIVMIIPVLILVLFGQRAIVAGLTRGALK
jgi:ABC-type glycerol-3-phosphate transport system permease component